MEKNPRHCLVCENCKKIERTKIAVLRCCNPPFSSVTQDVVDVWNSMLRDFPCQQPLHIVPLSEQGREVALQAVKDRKEICGYKRGAEFHIHNETWMFYDAQAEGDSWKGILLSQDGRYMMYDAPPELLKDTFHYF